MKQKEQSENINQSHAPHVRGQVKAKCV